MKFKLLLALVVTIGLYRPSNAQTTPSTYVPNVIPPSPNAATLQKFSDVPVSPYTGTADISVPLYTIQAKGLSVPIDMAYHTGGIKLSEESGWIGLGWALNAGGMISRTINDKDDFGGGYFNTGTSITVPQPNGDLSLFQPSNGGYPAPNQYNFEFNCSYLVQFQTGGADSLADFSQAFGPLTNPYDMEPDFYNFSFPGHSGKFIILRNGKVVLAKQENLVIQMIGNGTSFIITDDQGNKFYFNDIETGGLVSSPNTASSWHLSKIVTNQNDVVTFTYGGTGANFVASQQTQTFTSFCTPNGFTTSSNTGYMYTNVILSKIDYAGGEVQFSFDARTDQQGGDKLNNIKIYARTSAGLTYLKEHDFYYSYFNPGTTMDLERLRLDSVKEISNGVALRPHSFIYNDAALNGGKQSFSIDHWGYYNGAGNTQLIPTSNLLINGFHTFASFFSYSGANREPAFPAMSCFALKQITYPTGGYSQIAYDANTYDYAKSIQHQNIEYPSVSLVTVDTVLNITSSSSGTIDFRDITPLIPLGFQGFNATVNIAFISSSSQGWSPTDKSNGFNGLSFTFNGSKTALSDPTLTCSGPACSTSYQIAVSQASATAYTWTANYDSSLIPPADFSEIHVSVQFQALRTTATGNPTVMAGGLRVASITDFTANGVAAKQRKWDYHYGPGDQNSYGQLMSFPSYAHNEYINNAGGSGLDRCTNFILFSSSNVGLTSLAQGNIVGYSQVAEYTVNPSNGADNGKIVYQFNNNPDSVIYYGGFRLPGILNVANNLNGTLLSKTTYRNNGGTYWKVAESDNYYHTANKSLFFSAKYRGSVNTLNPGGSCGTTGVSNAGDAYFFPSLKSERILQDSSVNISYNLADTTKLVRTSQKMYYDNKLHFQVTRAVSTDSKSNRHVAKTTYPQDYIVSTNTGNAILDSLIAHNMVATPIEKVDSLYYPGAGSGYVTAATESRYKQLTNLVMEMDKVYKLDVAYPVTDFTRMTVSGNTYSQDTRYRQLVGFDAYDAANNVAQYTVPGANPVAILWDYRNISPIAQVKSAALADIAYTSFEADGSGNWTIGSAARDSITAAITGTKSYNLASGSITKAGLTGTTTYIVTYWTKNASPLTITGTVTGFPTKGVTINGWTFYEHQVTGQTGITLSGSGNIDELRLYPKGAQMTSYTYAPLVGVTSINDARAGINYFEYDGFQRLVNVKDQYGNIVKHTDYHYQNQ